MKTVRRIGFPTIAALLLAGCGSADDESPRPEPPPVEDTAFGDLAGTMDKARAVQDVTLQHKEDIDRALQESERESHD